MESVKRTWRTCKGYSNRTSNFCHFQLLHKQNQPDLKWNIIFFTPSHFQLTKASSNSFVKSLMFPNSFYYPNIHKYRITFNLTKRIQSKMWMQMFDLIIRVGINCWFYHKIWIHHRWKPRPVIGPTDYCPKSICLELFGSIITVGINCWRIYVEKKWIYPTTWPVRLPWKTITCKLGDHDPGSAHN